MWLKWATVQQSSEEKQLCGVAELINKEGKEKDQNGDPVWSK